MLVDAGGGRAVGRERVEGREVLGADGAGRAVEDERAVAERDDALEVAQRELRRVQRGDERALTLAGDAHEQADGVLGAGGVDRGDGLVGDDRARVLHEQARERAALLLAAREPRGALVNLARDADLLERGERAPALAGRDQGGERAPQAPPAEPAGEDVVDDAEAGHELVLLVDHADEAGQLATGLERIERAAVDPDRAAVGADHTGQQVQQRGLAGAARPDDGDGLAGGDLEAERRERHGRAVGAPGVRQREGRAGRAPCCVIRGVSSNGHRASIEASRRG